jgi:outer membrane protein OmpA-like peptidoglycan-associated protein
MNTKAIILIIVLLKTATSFAQKTDTVRFFYNINEYQLSQENKTKLSAVVDSLKGAANISVSGYADYIGNSSSNQTLSLNRANTVKEYLLSANKILSITADGKGTVAASSTPTAVGEPQNRRVDIVFTRPKPVRVVVVKPQPSAPPVIKPTPPPANISFADKVKSLDKLQNGSSLTFEELTFQPGRHFLNPGSKRYLDTLAGFFTKHPDIKFEIQGHICCDYGDQDGLDNDTKRYELSTNRAKLIYDYFASKGIDTARMRYIGLGSSKPKVYPEVTEYDRYLNRRVELVILNK